MESSAGVCVITSDENPGWICRQPEERWIKNNLMKSIVFHKTKGKRVEKTTTSKGPIIPMTTSKKMMGREGGTPYPPLGESLSFTESTHCHTLKSTAPLLCTSFCIWSKLLTYFNMSWFKYETGWQGELFVMSSVIRPQKNRGKVESLETNVCR